jgi:hypothetical protein
MKLTRQTKRPTEWKKVRIISSAGSVLLMLAAIAMLAGCAFVANQTYVLKTMTPDMCTACNLLLFTTHTGALIIGMFTFMGLADLVRAEVKLYKVNKHYSKL